MSNTDRVIIRDDGLKLGSISIVPYFAPVSSWGRRKGSGTFLTYSSVTGKLKYFVSEKNAECWLNAQAKNTYPISRLGEFIR